MHLFNHSPCLFRYPANCSPVVHLSILDTRKFDVFIDGRVADRVSVSERNGKTATFVPFKSCAAIAEIPDVRHVCPGGQVAAGVATLRVIGTVCTSGTRRFIDVRLNLLHQCNAELIRVMVAIIARRRCGSGVLIRHDRLSWSRKRCSVAHRITRYIAAIGSDQHQCLPPEIPRCHL